GIWEMRKSLYDWKCLMYLLRVLAWKLTFLWLRRTLRSNTTLTTTRLIHRATHREHLIQLFSPQQSYRSKWTASSGYCAFTLVSSKNIVSLCMTRFSRRWGVTLTTFP